MHVKFLLVDDVAIIGSTNWTWNAIRNEEISCIICVNDAGRYDLLQKFVAWRTMSTEVTSEDVQLAVGSRMQRPLARSKPVSAVAPGSAQVAASSVHSSPGKWRRGGAGNRAKSSPPGSPSKSDDKEETKETNFILQERFIRKRKEAQDARAQLPRTQLTAKDLTEDELQRRQAIAELETLHLERKQEAEDWLKRKEEERARSGGIAPMMSV